MDGALREFAKDAGGLAATEALTPHPRMEPTFEEVRAQKLAAALKMMSPSERHRFEHFCRSRFSLSAIKQLLADLHGVKSTPTMAVVVAGLAKLYVGEIVETARSAMEAHGEVGAIQPRHLREAHRTVREHDEVRAQCLKRPFALLQSRPRVRRKIGALE